MDVGLAALDERGWVFSFVDRGVFTAGFRLLGILKRRLKGVVVSRTWEFK
jgi:hypothetical protein